MRTVSELEKFLAKYFPQGMVENDGDEIILRTGLLESRNGQLEPIEDDGVNSDIDHVKFQRYRSE